MLGTSRDGTPLWTSVALRLGFRWFASGDLAMLGLLLLLRELR